MSISSQDKAWINAELKAIDRQKNREYVKRGKSLKYKKLAKKFKPKFEIEAEKYLQKNMDYIMETNPGKAYCILKRMGAQPGDCVDTNTYSLPGHETEGLTDEESAERIATHFAGISQEFPPLNINSLPLHVQRKIKDNGEPPTISEYDVYCKIMAAKKPKSGGPW